MAKYIGRIGFVTHVETSVGVYEPSLEFVKIRGDVLKDYASWQKSDSVNDDINISNKISIVATKEVINNISIIKCVEYAGSLWKINGIEIQRPRIILTIGGIYNE